jgi:nucleoredoxin
MRRAIFLAVLFLSILSISAASLPLTVKEVGLMLRSGYPTANVMQELSKRHCLDTLDAANEQQLIKAGASADLIAALKNGTYAISAAEQAKAQEQMAEQAKHRAAEAEKSRQFNTLYQAQVARERKANAALAAANVNVIVDAIKNDLVRMENGHVTPCDPNAIASKKLIAFYFSAQWCGPCRKFTPQLVDYYNRVLSQHPDVEVVFCSADRSAADMQKYMVADKMPWPAIDYAKLDPKSPVMRYAGKGIPCLVLVDPSGRVVSNSYDGDKYLGPQKVLADMDSIFAQVAAKRTAKTD